MQDRAFNKRTSIPNMWRNSLEKPLVLIKIYSFIILIISKISPFESSLIRGLSQNSSNIYPTQEFEKGGQYFSSKDESYNFCIIGDRTGEPDDEIFNKATFHSLHTNLSFVE